MEIDWNRIEVGKQYLYEEKYHTQAKVTILENLTKEGDNFARYSIRIDEAYRGCEEGEILTVGKITKGEGLYLVSHMKFKTLGSSFDYI